MDKNLYKLDLRGIGTIIADYDTFRELRDVFEMAGKKAYSLYLKVADSDSEILKKMYLGDCEKFKDIIVQIRDEVIESVRKEEP